MPAQGIAYQFWLRLERTRVENGWTATEVSERSGIPRSTIDRLKDSTRRPKPRIVYALADTVGIPRDEATELAGLLPADDGGNGVREAIARSGAYTPEQKRALLLVVDALDAQNRADRDERADGGQPRVADAS